MCVKVVYINTCEVLFIMGVIVHFSLGAMTLMDSMVNGSFTQDWVCWVTG